MPNPDNPDPQLLRYLLGQSSTEERTAIERRYLEDTTFLEQLEAAESDLIEAYLDNKLSEDERRRFEAAFWDNPKRRRKIQLVSALRPHYHRPVGPSRSWMIRFGVAAALLIGVCSSVVYFEMRPPEPIVLRQLIQQRSMDETAKRISIAPAASIVHFRLDLTGVPISQIDRVLLHSVEDERPVWTERIHPGRAATQLDVIIQSAILKRGDYILTVDSGSRTLASYVFSAD